MSFRTFAIAVLATSLGVLPSTAGSLQQEKLEAKLKKFTLGFEGRIGVCAQDRSGTVCVNGEQRYSLQSVMKLIVGVAVMGAIDHSRYQLSSPVMVRKEDRLYVQPIAKLVGGKGLRLRSRSHPKGYRR